MGSSSVTGDETILFADNMSFDGTPRGGKMTANGQLWIGSAVSPHVRVGTLSSSDSSITWTVGNGTISGTVTGGSSVGKTITGNDLVALSPSSGNWNIFGAGSIQTSGSGNTLTASLVNMTNHSVLVGAGTSTLTKLTVGTNGQVLIGATAADPAFATLTSTGGTVSYTTGANSLNLEVVNGGFPWTDITSATQTLVINNGYVANRGGGVTFTLPATATEGNMMRIAGKAGLWVIAQNANQQILVGSGSTTVGVTGTVTATNAGDCIELLCTTSGASTIWRALSTMGNLTLA